MTLWETANSKWATAKPVVIALAIGLVAGPFISNYIGWQVTSSAAQAQVRAGIVERTALFCEERARAEVKDSGKLDWSARSDLAKKWAVAPGAPSAETDVTMECARKLAA
jgi:hypothetical protein